MEVDNAAEINTDTASTGETIQKGGGDSPASFDDLEAVQNSSARSKELEVDTIKQVVEEVSNKKAAKPNKKEAAKVEEAPAEEAEADELPEVKLFKAKNGRDEIELRADMEVPVTIDGEETNVSLNELRNGYAGQATIKQRFDQLASEKNQYQTDRQSLDTFVSEVFQEAETDPISSMIKIAERAGLDPVKYQMSLLDSLSEQAEQWSAMSDEEREVYKYNLENQQLKSKLSRTENTYKQTQERAQVDNRVNEIQKELGVDREVFAESYYDVVDYFNQEGLDVNEITPEVVAEYIVDKHNESEASEILKSIDPELGENWDAVNTLMSVAADNPDLTDDDLREIAAEAWGGNKKAEKVGRKIAKGKPDMVNDAVSRNADKTPLSFDELESIF